MARERRSVGYICLNMVFCLLQANAMKEAILVREAARTLSNRLPPGWSEKILASKPTAKDRPDGTLEITSPDGTTARMVFEAKSRVFPRDVAELKNRLERYSSGPYLVVAPFLGPSTRRRLQEQNLNYVDTTGNVRLVVARPGVYVANCRADRYAVPKPAASCAHSVTFPRLFRFRISR